MDHDAAPPLLNDEDLREIARWAADCAERALPVFEAAAPSDRRPHDAIAAARVYVESGERTAALRTAAWSALAAAREVGDPAAAAAARAACAAAGAAYTHPIATPHQVNHIVGPAAYAARAVALRAPDEAGRAETEILWALEQASPQVREIVRRMPERAPSKGGFHALLHRLDTGLRS